VAQAKVRRTQRERSEITTTELTAAARSLFAAHGYAATLLDDVVQRAGLTKGALYHHFHNKEDLFAAVFEQEQARLAQAARDAFARKRDPWDGFYEGCKAFMEDVLDPGVQRIVLHDGPSVLGWDRLHEIEGRHTIANIRAGIQLAIDEGILAPRPIEPLVQFLNGGLCDAAILIARSDDQRATQRRVLAELRAYLDALATGPARIPSKARRS
jgi:AcrR family transcriptional regulator